MSGKTLDLSIIVRLIDKLTGPLTALQRKLSGLTSFAKRLGAIGGIVAGLSFAGPVASAASFDQKLRDIVVTAGLAGDAATERINELGRSFEKLALRTGVASSQIADAAGVLVSSGMNDKVMERLLPSIANVSKASGAAAVDVAKVAFALSDQLSVAAGDMEGELAKLVVAGKLGRFEFRNMARELPGLAAQFGKFGVQGREAVEQLGASLQVAMFGADDTSVAANNFKNFLSKLLSGETIANFKKFGVGIEGVMKDAAIKGINPVEAAIQKVVGIVGMSTKEMAAICQRSTDAGMPDAQAVDQVTRQIERIGGAAKLTQLFGDMQVLDWMLPMLQNLDKYKAFRAEIAGAGTGVIGADAATQRSGLQSKLGELGETLEQLGRRVGRAFEPIVTQLNDALKAGLAWIESIDQKWPGAIDTVLVIGAAVLTAAAAFGALAVAMPVVSAALGLLGALLTPVGAAIAIFAGLAVLIFANWGKVGPFFGQMWNGIKGIFSGTLAWITGVFTGDFQLAGDGLKAIFAGLGSVAGGAWNLVKASWTGFISWVDGWTYGALTGAINGVKKVWQGLIDWFKRNVPSLPSIEIPEVVKDLIGGGTAPAAHGASGSFDTSGASGSWGATGFAPARAGGTTKVGGEIIVRAEQGTSARVESRSPDVPLVQDRGAVLGRP